MKTRLSAMAAGLGKTLAFATGGLTLLTGALAGVASTVGIHTAIEDLDNLGDTATKIGIATEALAGLQHAAKLSGVESESLTKALAKMQRGISQAVLGAGPAATALQDLGLDATALKAAGPEQAFQKIAAAINQIPDAADRVAVSMDVFGKAGADLLPLIAESGELGERIKEAADIGLAATRAQVAEVGAANDALDTMKNAFKGLFRTVAVAIAPFVQGFAEGITDAIKWIQQFRDDLVRVFRQVQFVLQNFPEYLDLAFNKAMLKVVTWTNDLENIFTSVIPSIFAELPGLVEPAFAALGTKILYELTKITNTIIAQAGSWVKIIQSAVGFDVVGTAVGITEAISATKNRQEGDIERVLREDSERAAKRLDKILADSANKIRGSFAREKGPLESAMSDLVTRQESDLSRRMQDFVDKKMSALGIKKKGAAGEDDFERSGKSKEKTENKAIEKGTQEALKIVAGRAEDKSLKKMDTQIDLAKKANDLLKMIANRPGIKAAHV